MINRLKEFPQKWFLLGLVILAVLGSLAGMYLFENDFYDKLVSKKNPPKAPVKQQKGPEEEGTAFKTNISEAKLTKLVASLSLEEKIGQMLLIGFPKEGPSLEWKEFLVNQHIGGVMLNSDYLVSAKQTIKVTANLQELGKQKGIPLFLASNQINIPEKTVFPGNMALGATKSSLYAYRFGRVTGQELKALGINLNLTPVLDLATNHTSPVTGNQAFSDDPALAALLGGRYLAGLQNTGVAAAVKHFPGLGEAQTDPKHSVPILALKQEELAKRELLPFKKAIQENTAAVLVGHGLYPEIDPRYPASLSDKFVTGLLRSKDGLDFEGIVIADDLSKKAVTDSPGTIPGAVQAVKAGADLLIITNKLTDQQGAYKALVNAVRKGEIKESQIDASVKRILRAKFRYALVYPAKQAKLREDLGASFHRKWADRIAQQSITLVKDEQKALPIQPQEKILLLTPNELPAGQPEYLAEKLTHYYTHLTYQKFVNYRTPEEKNLLLSQAKKNDTVIIATYNAGPNQASLVKDMLVLPKKKVVVVALGNPYDLELFPQVPTYLASYGYQNISLDSLVKVLTGQLAKPAGILPVKLQAKGEGNV